MTGIPPVALEELWRAETSRVGPSNTVPRAKTSAMRSWLGRTYERGSDLFVAGKFNILRAHDDLLRPTFAALSDPPSLQDMLFHPCDLQAAAYFPTVLHSVCEAFPFSGSPFQLRRAISPASTQSQSFTFRRISRILGHVDGADYPPRQHLLRYRVWWDDPDHINQLDELEDARAAYDKAASDVAERLDAIYAPSMMNCRRASSGLTESTCIA